LFPGLNWEIFPGEHWALVGPNGSGKSLLAAALAGRLRVLQGELGASEAATLREGPGGVILVSQADHGALAARYSLFHQARWNASEADEGPSVEDLLEYRSVEAINPYAVLPEREDEAAFDSRRKGVIELFRLTPLLKRRALQLSNGEGRKLLLARALLRAPRLLVLDDPFAGLDSSSRADLHEILEGLARGGTTLVIASARIEDMPAFVDRFLRLEDCRITGQGRAGDAAEESPPSSGDPSGDPRLGNSLEPRRGEGRASPANAAQGDAPAIVELRSVTVRYGETIILDRVDFRMRKGEHWALLGANGAGKSTLLSLLLGDNPQAYANDVRLFGRRRGSGESIWDIKSRIGWVAPELLLHFPAGLRCLDVVLSGFHSSLGLFEDSGPEDAERALEELSALGLAAGAEEPLGALSVGNQRLVLLARALVSDPELLILDEPCQGLDAAHVRLVTEEVDRLGREGRASIIYVTHLAEQIPPCVTHVLRLEAGRAREG
jgi:molybdate transport system ATP-binding protein